ncbi:unnamed protein product, partial [Linum tenue]
VIKRQEKTHGQSVTRSALRLFLSYHSRSRDVRPPSTLRRLPSSALPGSNHRRLFRGATIVGFLNTADGFATRQTPAPPIPLNRSDSEDPGSNHRLPPPQHRRRFRDSPVRPLPPDLLLCSRSGEQPSSASSILANSFANHLLCSFSPFQSRDHEKPTPPGSRETWLQKLNFCVKVLSYNFCVSESMLPFLFLSKCGLDVNFFATAAAAALISFYFHPLISSTGCFFCTSTINYPV